MNNDIIKHLVGKYRCFKRKIKECWRYINKHHNPIIASAAIVSLFLNIVMMTSSAYLNNKSIDLANRPYVSINMNLPICKVSQDDVGYGNNIILENKGKTPASNVITRLYITTDLDKSNREGFQWFEENLGGYGSISFLVPNVIGYEPGFRSLSPSALFYYFEAIVSYEGLDTKKYWTHIKKAFYIDKNKILYPVFTYGEWDRNKNFNVPQISTEKQVVESFEKLKSKIKKYK